MWENENEDGDESLQEEGARDHDFAPAKEQNSRKVTERGFTNSEGHQPL